MQVEVFIFSGEVICKKYFFLIFFLIFYFFLKIFFVFRFDFAGFASCATAEAVSETSDAHTA